jgi:large subunit ribosomal protein L24
MSVNIKKDDLVLVLAGKNKGKKAKVLSVIPKTSKVIVEGVNVVKKHEKPSAENQTGGITEKEMPIHISNVMLIEPKTGEPTRVVRKRETGKPSIRVSVKTKNEID